MMRRLRRLASDQHAFTLSEMLIVLAIMGVLSGVAMWSFAAVRDSAEPIADDLTETGVQLRCDAARGGLLFLAGCEGQTLPASLAEPQLGPVPTTLEVIPSDGSTVVNGTAVLDVSVRDQVDDPFEDAQVRFEMFGIGYLSGQSADPTDPGGTTTISYSRSVSGTDTITICTNVDGTLPDDCDSATGP